MKSLLHRLRPAEHAETATEKSGKRMVGYFVRLLSTSELDVKLVKARLTPWNDQVNWGIYDRQFPPQDIPFQHLTHINYAFGSVKRDSGEVHLSDAWADVEIHYEGDDWNEQGSNLYGCLKAIFKLKKQNRNLKVLLSIGGATATPIDWEQPADGKQAQGYVSLLQELRAGLDQLAHHKGRPRGQYQLTVAVPCGMQNMQILKIDEMDRYLDFWNLMFAGSWEARAGHQANLYSDSPDGHSADKASRYYTSQGVHPSKIVIGMPLYGRAFANTDGIGASYSGVGEGKWEAGMWDYKTLPQPGAEEINDHRLGASYSYDRTKRLLISYDTQPIVTQKAKYITQYGLGGAMFWELDADKPEQTGGAIVRTVKEQFGQLERRENELSYPGSKSLPYNPSTFDSLTSSLNTTTTSFPPTAVGNDVSHLPTWSIALSKLAPLSTLLGKRRRQKQVVSLIVCVMEVEQSKQLQTKEEKARGMPGTLWIGHWKVTAPPAEGELPVSCGVKLWKEFGEKWGSGAMRKGDVVLLTNVEFNPPSELTVDSRSKPTITILYRTSPSYAGREMKMCPEDRALRPDLRLARSDAALRKVVDFARWFAGEFGGEGPP
ncbi:chitinase, partial [Tremellales sp. Uapishka_1]